MSTPPSNHNIAQWGKASLKFAKVFLSNVMRDAYGYGVIMHQAAHSSRWRTENVDIRFVLFSQKNIFSRMLRHLGKIQIRKSKLASLISN